MKEQWKSIKGFEGLYEISNLGRLKYLERIAGVNGARISKKERLLLCHIDSTGYLIINLYKNKKNKRMRLHQLLAIAFLGHEPCGFAVVVDHIDNNKLNNDLSNLQLISHRENISKDRKGATSKYTGVRKQNDKWSSMIVIDGKSNFLGLFKNELDAANAYINSLEDYKNGCFVASKYNEFKPTSKFKGVAWHKGNESWQSYIRNKAINKVVYLGYSKCEVEALNKIIAYKKKNPEVF